MAIIEYPKAAFLILFFLASLFYLSSRRRWNIQSSIPTNWPLLGMLPGLVQNAHRVHDFATEFLKESGGTFEFKGPWFSNSDMLITTDPANVHHVLSRNFSNYPKGPEFREIFDVLGDGIFNADFDLWELHRKTTMALMNHADFHRLLEQTIWGKVEKGLFPVLEYFCKLGVDVDLQDLFQRLTFDSISKLVLDHDPGSLSIDLPWISCEKAFNDAIEGFLYRHILPKSLWKFQKRLRIGKERKLIEAWRAFDEFTYSCISRKQEELSRNGLLQKEGDYKLLTGLLRAYDGVNCAASGGSRKFLRDTFLNLIFAGRDTTSTALTWLFWLLSKNPSAETKILDEIEAKLHDREPKKWRIFSAQESHKLVYLHGALCESLRLFPPVSLEHKAPAHPDVLPSGHRVNPNTRLVISFYSMGRMESIWGNDCLEFKPERWISERGQIKREPSFKFPAFNAGPRTCIGKEMAFIQMKMVAASIIYSYHVEVLEDHPVFPSASIIIQMKHGLKVRLGGRKAK